MTPQTNTTDRPAGGNGTGPLAPLQVLAAERPAEPRMDTEPRREIEARTARLEDEMEAARRQGVWGLMRLRYEAWLEERMQGPAVRKLVARQAILEEQRKTAEAEIRLKAVVQSGEVGAQRHKIEWNEVNRQRLAGELRSLGMVTLSPGPAPALPVPSPSPSAPANIPPPVSVHVTDEQVEALALHGFLQGVETEADWPVFREELSLHLPPYAVEEVGARLRELWRQAQGHDPIRGGDPGREHEQARGPADA